MKKSFLFLILISLSLTLSAQNESKLVIDASSNQSNENPLIRLRNFFGSDWLWISSDHPTNSFLGNKTGEKNTTGIANTAIGHVALHATSSGQYNTGTGAFALANNPNGNYNTAIGSGAITQTYTASYNTALGYFAGYIRNFGWNNVLVGANTDANQDGLFNVIAIGQGTIITSSSTARFGNSATGSYGGWANWTNISDGRYKRNIQANVPGLDFILRLRPVTYQLDVNGLSKSLGEAAGAERNEASRVATINKENVIQTGFIAQEVKQAAQAVGYNFSGIDLPKNAPDFYGLRYEEFVVPLVQSIMELNQNLVTKIINLHTEHNRLVERLKQAEVLAGIDLSRKEDHLYDSEALNRHKR